jgi:hypothetical protein
MKTGASNADLGCGCNLKEDPASIILAELMAMGVGITAPSLLISRVLIEKDYEPDDIDLAIELQQCAAGMHELLLPGDIDKNDITIDLEETAQPGREYMRFFDIDGELRYVFCTNGITAAFNMYAGFMRLKFKNISNDALKLAAVANMVRGYLVFRDAVKPFMPGDDKYAGGVEIAPAIKLAQTRIGTSPIIGAVAAAKNDAVRIFDGLVIENFLAIMFTQSPEVIMDLEQFARLAKIDCPERGVAAN